MLKQILFIGLWCGVAAFAQGQTTINKSIDPGAAQKLDFVSLFADVRFESWSGSSIEISGSVSINDGKNDELYELNTYVRDGKVVIEDKLPNMDEIPRYVTIKREGKESRILLKKNENAEKALARMYPDGKGKIISQGSDIDIKLVVKVPGNIDLDIRMTYGSVYLDKYPANQYVDNTYGTVEAELTSGKSLPEIKLKSTYGAVDVAVSPSSSFEVDMESDYGSLYSDLPLQIDKSRSKTKAFSEHIIGSLNGGSNRLELRAPYGNIYLRSL